MSISTSALMNALWSGVSIIPCVDIWSQKKNIRTADSLKYLQGAMEGEVGLFYQVAKPVAEVSSQGAVVFTAFELALPKVLLQQVLTMNPDKSNNKTSR